MKRNYTSEQIPYELEKDRSRAYLSPGSLRGLLLKPGAYICVSKKEKRTVLRAVPKFDGDDSAIYLPREEMEYLGIARGEAVSIEKDSLLYKEVESIAVQLVSVKKTAEMLESIKVALYDKKAIRNGEIFFGGTVRVEETSKEEKAGTHQSELAQPSTQAQTEEQELVKITDKTKIRIVSKDIEIDEPIGFEKERKALCHTILQAHTKKKGVCRGVFISGGVGMGKKTLCRKVLQDVGHDWVQVKAAGSSTKNIQETYEYAKINEPCTVWIDRIDRVFSEEKEQINLPGIEDIFEDIKRNSRRVCIVATSVSGASLPSEIKGPFFFEKEIFLAPPALAQRKRQIEESIKKKSGNALCLCTESVIEEAAKRTAGFSRGDIYLLLRQFMADKEKDAESMKNITDIPTRVKEIGEKIQALHTGPNPMPSTEKNPFITNTTPASHPNSNAQSFCGKDCFKELLGRIIRTAPSASNEKPMEVPDIRFSSILGQEEAKERLTEAVVWPVKHADLFLDVGVQPSKGVLLYGPPGCGKTLLAQALANESGAVFLSIRGPEIMGKYVGESEQRLRRVFLQARANSPAIIFIDEIDSIAPHREAEGGQVDKRVVSTLLAEMDGVGTAAGIFVLGATNKPWSIDSALLRPGRFDCHLLVGLPETEARRKIVTQRTDRLFSAVAKWSPETSILQKEREHLLQFLVEHTSQFTAAELVGLCNDLCFFVIRMQISQSDKRFHFLVPSLIEETKKAVPRISRRELSLFAEYKQKTSSSTYFS